MFTVNQKESFLAQPKSERKVNMSREGKRDTLKIECMLKTNGCTVSDFLDVKT